MHESEMYEIIDFTCFDSWLNFNTVFILIVPHFGQQVNDVLGYLVVLVIIIFSVSYLSSHLC